MTLLRIDCSVGDGGGGVMRTALTLSVLTRTPIHLVNVRRHSSEPGLGWPHITMIRGCASWTKANVDYCHFGSTELIFWPGTPDKSGTTLIDLDGEGTVSDFDVRAQKDFKAVKDVFFGRLSNRNGCGVKGHSVVTPLIPIINAVSGLKLAQRFVLKGGTETPGAPFLDAYDRCAASRLRGMGVIIEIRPVRRGCIGIGGGEVVVDIDATRATVPGPAPTKLSQADSRVSLVFYVYGSPEYFQTFQASAAGIVSQILDKIATVDNINYVFTEYQVDRMHALMLIGNSEQCVEAAICHEEFNGQRQPWKHPMFGHILARRLDVAQQWLVSDDPRIFDQLLPAMKAFDPSMPVSCIPSTGHLQGVLGVMKQFGM